MQPRDSPDIERLGSHAHHVAIVGYGHAPANSSTTIRSLVRVFMHVSKRRRDGANLTRHLGMPERQGLGSGGLASTSEPTSGKYIGSWKPQWLQIHGASRCSASPLVIPTALQAFWLQIQCADSLCFPKLCPPLCSTPRFFCSIQPSALPPSVLLSLRSAGACHASALFSLCSALPLPCSTLPSTFSLLQCLCSGLPLLRSALTCYPGTHVIQSHVYQGAHVIQETMLFQHQRACTQCTQAPIHRAWH